MDEEGAQKGRQLGREVGRKEKRKIKARKSPERSIWFGFGMFGLIGWSVAVPMLLGTALGLWLDRHHPAEYSWTLTMLLVGLVIGCLNAWFWVEKEQKEMHKELENDDE